MSYATRAALGFDSAFRDRVITCCKEQALVFVNDGRDDIASVARDVIENQNAAQPIVDLVVVSPSFVDVEDSETILDPAILSSVQAVWPTYAGVAYPPDVTPTGTGGGGGHPGHP